VPASLDETQIAPEDGGSIAETALAHPSASERELTLRDAPPNSRRAPTASLSAATGRGSTIGRYVVLDVLGQGGMGVVYTAYDPELDRRVALKLLRPKGRNSELAATRLLREAQAMAKLSHPHVVTVHDVGQHEGKVFIAMEYVEGETLSDWVERGPHPIAEIVERFAAAGRGLAAAHRAGLVHRDFKPDNVLLGNDGRVQVADFGLARSASEATGKTLPDAPPPEDLGSSSDDLMASSARGVSIASRVTRTGAFLGTPAYMSPEQFRGGELGPQSDQFSFAVALWEAIYGERPFAGENPNALAFQVLQGERREPPNPSAAPRRIRQALDRALATDPEQRHTSMDTFLAELAEAKLNRWVLPGILSTVALGMMLWAQTLTDPAVADPCAGGSEQLESIWSATERESLLTKLSSLDVAWGKDAAARSVAGMDNWGTRFVKAHREACEATHVDHTQSEQLLDLRMLCLDRRLRRFDAIKTTLADADDKVLRRSEKMLRELDDLEACADPETLTQRLPIPVDPEKRASVLELQSAVERIGSLRGAGRYRDGLTIGRARLAEAAKLGYDPVHAELLFQLGRTLSENGDEEEAHEKLFSAFAMALASGEDKLAAMASAGLVSTSEELERKDGGDRWFKISESLCERAGGAWGQMGALYTNRGNALRARGQLEDAIKMHSAAYGFYVKAYGDRSMHAADATFNRSAIYWDMGRYSEAGRDIRRAASIWREHVGEAHPRVVRAMGAEALVVLKSGDGTRAVKLQKRVIERLSRLHGEESIQVADARLNLSAIASGAEQYKLAWEAGLAARKYYEKTDRTNTLGYGQILGNASSVALQLGRPEQAEELAQKTLDLLEAKLGKDHSHVSTAHIMLALALEDQGKLAAAKDHGDAGLQIMLDAKGADFPGLIENRTVLARIERKLGNPAAVQAHMAAGEALTKNEETPDSEVGLYWVERAAWRDAEGDAAGRDQALKHARTAFGKAGELGRRELAKMDGD
jgi:serine/threonine protein kinase/tetratricopeptide (TPR) repeat protein